MTVPKFKIIKIDSYRPGKSSVGKIKNPIKLSANESALGVSPKVKKILSSKNLTVTLIKLYVGLDLMKLFKCCVKFILIHQMK